MFLQIFMSFIGQRNLKFLELLTKWYTRAAHCRIYRVVFLTGPPIFQYQNEKRGTANQRLVTWNSPCTKDPRWLNNVFLFSAEIWADQSEKPPCITFISFFLRIFYSVDGLMSPSRWLMWCQKVSTSVPRNTSFDHTLPKIARDTHSDCKHTQWHQVFKCRK